MIGSPLFSLHSINLLILFSFSYFFPSIELPDVVAYAVNYILTYLIAVFLLKRERSFSTLTAYYLAIGDLLISFFSLVQFNFHITEGSRLVPILLLDARQYYSFAQELSAIPDMFGYVVDLPGLNHWGYPLFLGLIFKIMGVDLLWGMLANVFFCTINMALISILTHRLTNSQRSSEYALLLSLLYGQFIATGVILLKDGVIIFSVLLVTIIAQSIRNSGITSVKIILFIASTVILVVFRAQYIFIPVIIISALYRFRPLQLLMVSPILILTLWVGQNVSETYTQTEYSLEYIEGFTTETEGKMEGVWKTTKQSFMERTVSGFESWPIYRRLLYMPVFLGIQYSTPFVFWTGYDGKGAGPSWDYTSRRMMFLWFLFVGPILFYGLWLSWKQKLERPQLFSVSFSAFLMYLVPAFLNAGTVPRYAVPFVVLMIPCGSWLLAQVREEPLLKRNLLTLFVRYFLTALLALLFYLWIKL